MNSVSNVRGRKTLDKTPVFSMSHRQHRVEVEYEPK